MKFVRIIIGALCMTPFLLVISTVFVWNSDLSNGIVTGKYFWFYAAMGLASVVTLIFANIRKMYFCFTILDCLVLLFVGCVLFSSHVINAASQNTTKLALFALLVILYFNFRLIIKPDEKLIQMGIFFFIIITGLVEAVWGLLQLYDFIPSQHSLFKVTGSFFNPGPYAGYLAVVFPLALYYWITKPQSNPPVMGGNGSLVGFYESGKTLFESLWFKPFADKVLSLPDFYFRMSQIVATITCITILIVLPAAMNRASWLAVIAGSLIVLYGHYSKKLKYYFKEHKKKMALVGIVAGVLFFVAFAGMYFLKKDSADGRTLIWKIAFHAAKKHPLGVGLGNFSGAYGSAQAAYFASGKGTEIEENVAGNPEYGFNEYLQIAVESGTISLVLFLALILLTIKLLIKRQKWGVAGSMVSLLVFAFFSYPFSVLPILIIFVFFLLTASKDFAVINIMLSAIPPLPNNKYTSIYIYLFTLVSSLITFFCIYKEYPKYEAYKQWNMDKFLYSAGIYNDVVENYEELYPMLNDQIRFLFKYAQSFSKAEQYAESNEILKRAMQISCDPMLYNIMGNNFKAMGEYNKAENMYLCASHIIPNRHYPLYLLMKLYDDTGQHGNAKAMAEALLKKPIKIPSTAIREMHEEAMKIIKNE